MDSKGTMLYDKRLEFLSDVSYRPYFLDWGAFVRWAALTAFIFEQGFDLRIRAVENTVAGVNSYSRYRGHLVIVNGSIVCSILQQN
jgi:hypothetical protein